VLGFEGFRIWDLWFGWMKVVLEWWVLVVVMFRIDLVKKFGELVRF